MATKKTTSKKAAGPDKAAVPDAPVAEPVCTLPEDDAVASVVCVEPDRVLVFTLDGQRYGLPIDVVLEIQQIVALSEIPESANSAVVGIINVRGRVVPAVDLRLLVGLQPRVYDLQTPMVFVSTVHGPVALIVDEVEDVVEVPAGATQPVSRVYAMADRMLCVVRFDADLVFVFDIDRLVPDEAAAVAGGDGA